MLFLGLGLWKAHADFLHSRRQLKCLELSKICVWYSCNNECRRLLLSDYTDRRVAAVETEYSVNQAVEGKLALR